LPKQLEANGVTEENLKVTADVLHEMINNYTGNRCAAVGAMHRVNCAARQRNGLYGREVDVDSDKETRSDFIGKKVHSYEIAKPGEILGVVNGSRMDSVGGDTLEMKSLFSEGNGLWN
jgi:ATP-dependent Lon protease